MRKITLPCLFAGLLLLSCASRASSPIIYCTDLFHPHEDPDDHFDLVTLFSLPELEVKAILLDQGRRQLESPGNIPVGQVFKLYGKSAPVAFGLAEKLGSPSDDGRNQAARFQGAVDLLLKTLSNAPEPMLVFATGSVRDLCAAWNRDPALLRRKISRLYLNIGNADPTGSEYNVDLDSQAYRGLLASGLPIYLCLCLPMSRDGSNAVYSTWWKFRQDRVLESSSQPLRNFFIYALQRTAPAELDPVEALSSNLQPWHRLVWAMDRNMWCTAPLLHAAGRTMRKDTGWWKLTSTPGGASPGPDELFTFVPARVDIDANARTRVIEDPPTPNVRLFKVLRPGDYAPAMTDCLRELLGTVR
jgi:hypothetical protein